MGVVFLMTTCFYCDRLFGCNPNKVPSTKDKDGIKQPVCSTCVKWWNTLREREGLPAIPPLPGAYEPCNEIELIF